MISITRQEQYYRPLFLENKEIKRYYFHNGSKVILEYSSSCPCHVDTDIIEIQLNQVRNARTINLSKKDNFIIKFKDNKRGYYESGYSLYIYAPDLKLDSTITVFEDEYQIQYKDKYILDIPIKILKPYSKFENFNHWILHTNSRFIDKPKKKDLSLLHDNLKKVLNNINIRDVRLLLDENKIKLENNQITINPN